MKSKIIWFVGIIVLILSFYFVFNFSFAKVDGNSMKPLLSNKDIVLYKKTNHKLKRFDIIIFKLNNELFIKRVIGLPGENIEYIDNKLYVNGKYVLESFENSITKDLKLENIIPSQNIPKDKYLVLGDNRLYSYDSRDFGVIDINDIVGIFIIKIF